jgi:hypothetical protein
VVIYARERLALARPGVDWRYRCLLDGIEYPPHARYREERTACRDPRLPGTHRGVGPGLPERAGGARLRADARVLCGRVARPEGLDDALRLALRGVELKPAAPARATC